MKVALALLICLSISLGRPLPGCGQASKSGGEAPLYELYSWSDPISHDWCFKLMYNTSRQKNAKEVLDGKDELKGVNGLKKRIGELQPKTKIIWLGELTTSEGHKQKGSEKLGYPPEQVIQDVKQFALEREIEIVGPFKSSDR